MAISLVENLGSEHFNIQLKSKRKIDFYKSCTAISAPTANKASEFYTTFVRNKSTFSLKQIQQTDK